MLTSQPETKKKSEQQPAGACKLMRLPPHVIGILASFLTVAEHQRFILNKALGAALEKPLSFCPVVHICNAYKFGLGNTTRNMFNHKTRELVITQCDNEHKAEFGHQPLLYRHERGVWLQVGRSCLFQVHKLEIRENCEYHDDFGMAARILTTIGQIRPMNVAPDDKLRPSAASADELIISSDSMEQQPFSILVLRQFQGSKLRIERPTQYNETNSSRSTILVGLISPTCKELYISKYPIKVAGRGVLPRSLEVFHWTVPDGSNNGVECGPYRSEQDADPSELNLRELQITGYDLSCYYHLLFIGRISTAAKLRKIRIVGEVDSLEPLLWQFSGKRQDAKQRWPALSTLEVVLTANKSHKDNEIVMKRLEFQLLADELPKRIHWKFEILRAGVAVVSDSHSD